MAIWDKINKVTEKVVGSISGTQEDESTKSIHDEFNPTLGAATGKKTTFQENGLLFGSDFYPYSQLNPIQLVNKPTTQLMQGVAQAVTESGKTLTLVFAYNQTERFLKALNYANEQIALAHGTTPSYKYLLQSIEGSKLEIYEDYAQLYHLTTGFKNLLDNSMWSGGTTVTMYFPDMDIQCVGLTTDGRYQVIVKHNGESYVLELSANEQGAAQQAAEYISTAKQNGTQAFNDLEILKEILSPNSGKERRFTFNGEELQISQEMDVFNAYRLTFRQLAAECTDCVKAEFQKRVNNLTSYLQIFPDLYRKYLDLMVGKAMEIIVAEGIWSVTNEVFLKEHTSSFHLVATDVFTTMESVELTAQANQQAIANVMSYIPKIRGGMGFSIKATVKAMAGSTAFNLTRDTVGKELIKSAASINQAQQIELYNRINHDILFEHVFLDYWRVFLTLIVLLKSCDKAIWWPVDKDIEQTTNVFTNLSNPAFPKDKLVPVFVGILKLHPYNVDYYKFMVARFGETDEVNAIKDYFGYSDLSSPYTL